MKTLICRACLSVCTIIVALLFSSPALAHGDIPRLEISADRMNPGGVLDVRGVDFEFEQSMTLALIGPGVEIPLGEITADVEGIFLQIVTLPVDLPEGVYQFRAVAYDHEVLSPGFSVQGPAISGEEGGGQGLRDEDDGLLAPMPTYAPGVVPGGVAKVSTEPAEAPATSRDSLGFMALILLVLGIPAVFIGLRVARKK